MDLFAADPDKMYSLKSMFEKSVTSIKVFLVLMDETELVKLELVRENLLCDSTSSLRAFTDLLDFRSII